jgi:hypothetical protein
VAATPLDLLDALWTIQSMLEGLGAEPRLRWPQSAADFDLKRRIGEAYDAVQNAFVGARSLTVLRAEYFVARRAADHVRELTELQDLLVDGVRRKDLDVIPFERILDLALSLKNGLPSTEDGSSRWP